VPVRPGADIALRALAAAEVQYRQSHPSYTSSLAELQQVVGLPASLSYGNFLNGQLSVTATTQRFVARSTTSARVYETYQGGQWLARTQTLAYPGLEVASLWTPAERYYTAAGSALLVVAGVVDFGERNGLPITLNLREHTTSLPAIQSAFGLLDADGDGAITPREILGTETPFLQALLPAVQRIYQFDLTREQAGVTFEEMLAAGDQPALFSDDSLRTATEDFVTKAGVAGALVSKLDAAEAAEAQGNLAAKAGALGAYVNQLRAQRGKSLTGSEARALEVVARHM
jgi:hypothetical protein